MESIRQRRPPVAGEEKIDPRGAAGEFLFLGLRMIAGVSTKEFSCRFDREVTDCYPRIGDWISGGLMERSGERLRLTRRGLLLANSIFVDLV
jgi:oxygen-independent coproporphyrinogen-3 oxidase